MCVAVSWTRLACELFIRGLLRHDPNPDTQSQAVNCDWGTRLEGVQIAVMMSSSCMGK